MLMLLPRTASDKTEQYTEQAEDIIAPPTPLNKTLEYYNSAKKGMWCDRFLNSKNATKNKALRKDRARLAHRVPKKVSPIPKSRDAGCVISCHLRELASRRLSEEFCDRFLTPASWHHHHHRHHHQLMEVSPKVKHQINWNKKLYL